MSPGPVPADFVPPQRLALTQERLRFVVYGRPDAGKTTLAATFPRALFIDTDHNLITLALEGFEVMRLEPTGYRHLEHLYQWMRKNLNAFDTIVWDSISTGQKLLLNEIHDLALVGKDNVKEVMRWTPEQGEHQAQQRQMERILTDLRRLRKHIVLTAGVREEMGVKRPDVSPGNFSIVSYWASLMGELVVYTHDRDGQPLAKERRALELLPAGREAKCKIPGLKPRVWDPTFQKIWDAAEKHYADAEARQKAASEQKETAS